MKDVKITIVEGRPVTENGVTYDVETWLFDYGKKGTAKIIKRKPHPGPEDVRLRNRKEISRAVRQMALSAMSASPEQRKASEAWAERTLERAKNAKRILADDVDHAMA